MITIPTNQFNPSQPLKSLKISLPDTLAKNRPRLDHALKQSDLYTIRNLNSVVIYIWLKNGKNFWYYISHYSENYLVGYVLRQNNWLRQRIHYNLILAYY